MMALIMTMVGFDKVQPLHYYGDKSSVRVTVDEYCPRSFAVDIYRLFGFASFLSDKKLP